MLRQRQRSGAELRMFVRGLRSRDPELFAELEVEAQRALEARPGVGLDPAARALNEAVTEAAPGEDFAFESIIVTTGRPVLAIRRDAVDTLAIEDPAAKVIKTRLDAAKARLDRAIPAIGRIEVQNNPFYEWVGTGWLIDSGVIVTNRHVATAFGTRDGARFVFAPGIDLSRPQTARVDFLEELGRGEAIEIAVGRIIWIAPDAGPDVAFLELAKTRPGVARIELATSLPASGTQVAVIGYPARDSRIPDADLMDRLYGSVYDKKRLAPGQVLGGSDANVTHDCTTLGGNSGSVVLDLRTGQAVALHYSGVYLRANYAVPAPNVARILRERPWQGGEATRPKPSGVSAAGAQAGITVAAAPGGLVLNIPLSIDLRVGGIAATPAAASTGDIDEAVALVRAQLEGRSEVVSVRAGYLFRDGWITKDRAVVVRLAPDSAVDASSLGLGPSALGLPIDLRNADPAEAEAVALGLGDAEAPHRYVSTYHRELTGDLALQETRVARVLCHASPDAGWPTLKSFLGSVGRELVVAMYDFSAPHIVDQVTAEVSGGSATRKKSLRLVLDPKESLGGPAKADDRPEQDVIDGLEQVRNLDFRHAFAPIKGPHRLFDSAYHIKVAVADHRFWLSSGNWQSSNQPDVAPPFGPGQDPEPLRKFNREWHAIVQSADLARVFRAHILTDLEEAEAFPDTEALDLLPMPSVLVPLEYLEVPEEELPARATYFAPHEARDVVVLPLLSPDNYAQAVLDLVAGAGRQLLIQNQSFKPAGDSADSAFSAILDAVLAKQRAGLDVRIIFRKIGDVPDILERIQDYGFDMDRVRVQTNCHTKGIVVDGETVLLGSHNWTTAGVEFNRDASLIIKDAGAAAYFASLFEFDWTRVRRPRISTERRGREVIVVPPGAETPAPAGYVRMSWDEWTGV